MILSLHMHVSSICTKSFSHEHTLWISLVLQTTESSLNYLTFSFNEGHFLFEC